MWYLRTRADVAGRTPLLFLGGAVAIWDVAQVASLLLTNVDTKILIWQIQYIGIAGSPVAWLAFALVYSGRTHLLRHWGLVSVYILFTATLVLVFTNDRHGLIWSNLTPVRTDGLVGIRIEHGSWFRVHLGATYALLIVATGTLALHIAQSPRHWHKLVWVFGAPLVVLLSSLAYLTPLQPATWVDLTPAGFCLAVGILSLGLIREGIAGFAPVARTAVVEEMKDVVLVVDDRHQIVDVNRTGRELLGLRVTGPVPLELGAAWVALKADPDHAVKQHRLRLKTEEGEEREFEMRYGSLGPQAGRGRSVVVLRDITDRLRIENELRETTRALEHANREMERRANTDGLTGLANRRYFMEVLRKELERSDRYNRPLSLIMIDLDHFKQVNDAYGHAAGDSVLKAAAAAMHRVSRDSDLPARIGGEELAIVLPETHLEGAAQVAERLRTLIAAERHLSPHGTDFSVTASFGVATHLGGDSRAEELLQQADEALYTSKEKGRDRVTTAGWDPKSGERIS